MLNTGNFSYKAGELIISASDMLAQGQLVKQDIMIMSTHTARKVRFSFEQTQGDEEGDVVAWVYHPIAKTNCKRMIVLND